MKLKHKSGGSFSPGIVKIQQASRGSKGASKGFIGSQVPPTMKGGRFFGGVKDNSNPRKLPKLSAGGPSGKLTYPC